MQRGWNHSKAFIQAYRNNQAALDFAAGFMAALTLAVSRLNIFIGEIAVIGARPEARARAPTREHEGKPMDRVLCPEY